MDPLALLAIAFGLAIDALSVSVASATAFRSNSGNEAFKMAFSFGAFQAFMPLLGWFAFALLLFVGCKMIYESTKPETLVEKGCLGFSTFLIFSIATSIDALAARAKPLEAYCALFQPL